MSELPTLLFLHGVGSGDPEDHWTRALAQGLAHLGYPGLDAVTVIAPKYPNTLHGVDDDDPLPELTIKAPTGEAARGNRRDFERREAAVETLLGRPDRGTGWFAGDAVTENALKWRQFVQAANYVREPRVRAHALNRVLNRVPPSGRVVLVGHSLGSVIAADLVRRLPAAVEIVGMVTIGSPLANAEFQVDGMPRVLKEPPANLGWWVNFWNPADPVTTHRGISSVFPWMIDFRVGTKVDTHVHDAEVYLDHSSVAKAIGYALFGSRSKELAVVEMGVDMPLDALETWALMGLRYGYLIKTKLGGDQQERFAGALRQVQADAFDRVKERNVQVGRPIPAAIAGLAVDLSDPSSVAPEPDRITHSSKEDAVVALVSLATANVVRPFEITVAKATLREALEDLSIEMGFGRQFGSDVFTAVDDAQKALLGSGTNWLKWAVLGVGAAALVAATGGLALAAAPGVAGAAVITSALAAFGPGGMIGGLLTAGALLSAGGGGIALGLASPTTAAEVVEAFVSTQLAAALLRKRQGIDQDPTTWVNLAETATELQRERARLGAFSDDSAPALKDLKRKLDAVNRAMTYLNLEGLGPSGAENPEANKRSGAEFFDRATEVFRSVDLDGDGIPDKPRAFARAEDAGTAIKGAMDSLFRRGRDADASVNDGGPTPGEE